MLRTLRAVVATALLLLAGCGSPTPPASTGAAGSGTVVTIDGAEALQWGDGSYGVVLAHGAAFDAASWADQAVAIAAQDSTVLAVEDIGPDAIAAAVRYLQDQGHPDVALVGGSAGADAILRLVAEQPDLADQLVLLSPNTTQDLTGTQPKLFVASADEPVADVSRELADTAAGDDNDALIVPGSAHAQNIFGSDQAGPVTRALLGRLAEFA
jgi:pimeloyl-ACP methyl ester carboxylesterase